MECSIFCLPRPPRLTSEYALQQNSCFPNFTAWIFKWQLFWRQILVSRINIQFLVVFIYYASHHEAGLTCFASVPADLFIFVPPRRASASQHEMMSTVHTSVFPSPATTVDGLYRKSIYCTKKWERGEKTVCAIKNTKIQFHTCDRDPSTYHEYDIHKLLTLLYYSTYTILKLVPALRYVFPMMPLYRLQILDKSALQLYKKNLVQSHKAFLMQVLNLT